ncbi:hypothetical protein TELCIR_14947 [Teladorsagia circumcincta]|uniref:Uncharacterized protein n=1 Tax=Teladorsagia circumcincta TaxID=45464 RepID=A0A2G9U178_TELCI|nr:hypothetical protein TELCIR_14947 [Teladorsagia circumcincta]
MPAVAQAAVTVNKPVVVSAEAFVQVLTEGLPSMLTLRVAVAFSHAMQDVDQETATACRRVAVFVGALAAIILLEDVKISVCSSVGLHVACRRCARTLVKLHVEHNVKPARQFRLAPAVVGAAA